MATGRDHPPTTEAVWCQHTKVRGGPEEIGFEMDSSVFFACFFFGTCNHTEMMHFIDVYDV